MPTVSSITTLDGSLPQTFSIFEELIMPNTVRTDVKRRYQNKENLLIRKNRGMVANDDTVPGAVGALPIPKKVAIILEIFSGMKNFYLRDLEPSIWEIALANARDEITESMSL